MCAQRGDVRAQRRSTRATDKADVWTAGTLITVPGGHGTEVFPGIPTLLPGADPAAFVDQRIAEQADYIKIVLERRQIDGAPMPTLSERQVRALVGAARDRGLRSLAHVTDTDDAIVALDAGISGLAHVPADRPVGRDLIDRALAGQAFMTATITFDRSTSRRRHGERDIYADPRIVPHLSPHQRTILDLPFPPSPWLNDAWLEQGMANARALHQAGVPILAGTYAPIPGLANGVSLLATLETLVEAGLTPVAALASATSVPAECFGLTDRGRLQPGRRADLVLVDGDPTATITDLRGINAVWKNGTLLNRVP